MSYDDFIAQGYSQGDSLNPFGTGQCLTTVHKLKKYRMNQVSIPLEQGNVLRPSAEVAIKGGLESQSLWNRAMSYDCSGVLEPCGTRLARATSQLFPRLR